MLCIVRPLDLEGVRHCPTIRVVMGERPRACAEAIEKALHGAPESIIVPDWCGVGRGKKGRFPHEQQWQM